MNRVWHWLTFWRRRRVYFNATDICRTESTGELVVLTGLRRNENGGYDIDYWRRAA